MFRLFALPAHIIVDLFHARNADEGGKCKLEAETGNDSTVVAN